MYRAQSSYFPPIENKSGTYVSSLVCFFPIRPLLDSVVRCLPQSPNVGTKSYRMTTSVVLCIVDYQPCDHDVQSDSRKFRPFCGENILGHYKNWEDLCKFVKNVEQLMYDLRRSTDRDTYTLFDTVAVLSRSCNLNQHAKFHLVMCVRRTYVALSLFIDSIM